MTQDERSQVLALNQMPCRLRELSKPPERVWLMGELPPEPGVAIIGSRDATVEALDFARALGRDLTHAGVAVLSGGAKGIDTAAHLGALELGPTWVVAPSGWHRPYPQENVGLFRRVVDSGGGHLSVVADSAPATRATFFRRNAALVALTRLVIVVEASFRSGVMNAAKWARQLGRPVFWVPCSPWNSRGVGFAHAVERGWVEVFLGPGQILKRLDQLGAHRLRGPDVEDRPSSGPLRPSGPSVPSVPAGLSADQVKILQVLDRPLVVPAVAQLTGLPHQVVGHELLQLLMLGHVDLDSGAYLRSRGP